MVYSSSVTRLGDLLDFGQLFKAYGNNLFAQISQILRQFFAKVSKALIFLVKSFLGNFYRHLALYSSKAELFQVKTVLAYTVCH